MWALSDEPGGQDNAHQILSIEGIGQRKTFFAGNTQHIWMFISEIARVFLFECAMG